MKKTKDEVVAEIRQARAKVWKKYRHNPEALRVDSESIYKELGLQRSRLKPIAKSLKEIKNRKHKKSA